MTFKSTQWKEIDGQKWFRFDSKYDHFRYWWGNITQAVLVILLISFMVYMVFHIQAVIKDPLRYYASEQYKKTGEEVSCSCLVGDSFPQKKFNFNRTLIWTDLINGKRYG